ncbi:hypothetical protein [Leeia oryzae]|uniref:hypothetical protein n=1 Tax=Leeia oryzae TaxID=356662 RepID=UPI001461564B|nr:hypothetical protein [Leeia oryzae]
MASEYSVSFAGFGTCNIENVTFIKLENFPTSVWEKGKKVCLLLSRMHETFYWQQRPVVTAQQQMQNLVFDMVLANDIDSLPLALKIAKTSPVYFDAHEYHPREFEDKLSWRIIQQSYKKYLCTEYLQRCATMTTVCDGIADEYKKNYGVTPEVIRNVPDYTEIEPSPTQENLIRLIHHGAAIPSRNLEVMIDMFQYLDTRFQLDFMLVPNNKNYLASIKRKASKYSSIRFIPPVDMNSIVKSINNYDIGIFLLPPSNFNYRYALPNKIFEFIQARLGIAIGPSPEMEKVVRNFDVGIISSTFNAADLAERLNSLNQHDIQRMKLNSSIASRELCFESNYNKIISLSKETISRIHK